MDDTEFQKRVWMFAHQQKIDIKEYSLLKAEHGRRMSDRSNMKYHDSLEGCFLREVFRERNKTDQFPELKELYRRMILAKAYNLTRK